jgi:hypothetical protein
MAGISPEVYAELRRFVRENAPMGDEPDGDETGMSMGDAPPGAVAIEVKSEPESGGKTCPTCGHAY